MITRRTLLMASILLPSVLSGKSVACPSGDRVVRYLKGVNRNVELDSCIADIIVALNDGGIVTRSSCCGHGKTDGYILCDDSLIVVATERNKEDIKKRYNKDWDKIARNNEKSRLHGKRYE